MAVQTLSFGSQEADRRLNRLFSTSQRVLVMNFGFVTCWVTSEKASFIMFVI